MTTRPAPSFFSPRSPKFWLTVSLVVMAALRSWQRRIAPEAAPDHRSEALAARSERLTRAQAEERARIVRRAEVVQEELAHLVKERLPAALAVAEIPPSRYGHTEEGLDATVAESFEIGRAHV